LITPGTNYDIKTIVQRYKKISEGEPGIFVVPAEENILNKIIWPLKQAKVNYIIGNYVGVISLCGIVAEMIAMMTYEISDESCKLKSKCGCIDFERCGQEQRVKILKECGMIDDIKKGYYDLIRDKRKKYIHYWSTNHKSIAKDSLVTYKKSLQLVYSVIAQEIRDNSFVVNSDMQNYLRRMGAIA
jgi:hypothetical protein